MVRHIYDMMMVGYLTITTITTTDLPIMYPPPPPKPHTYDLMYRSTVYSMGTKLNEASRAFEKHMKSQS